MKELSKKMVFLRLAKKNKLKWIEYIKLIIGRVNFIFNKKHLITLKWFSKGWNNNIEINYIKIK